MLILTGLLIFLIAANLLLISNLQYKNHCIEDLETSKSRLAIRKNEEFLMFLWQLHDYQKFEPAGRETCTRNAINEMIEKLASENRKSELSIYSDKTSNR